jgi:hypothetical protein
MVKTLSVQRHFCERCDEEFGEAELEKALRHEKSDADHLYYKRVNYVKRSKAGVVFYPLFCLGRGFYLWAGSPSSEVDSDEKWLEKPEYEIFIQGFNVDRVTERVTGQMNAGRAYSRMEDDLLEKEGRLARKKFLGVTIHKRYNKAVE